MRTGLFHQRPRMRDRMRHRGLTMIELMMVVLIVAMSAALVIPQFGSSELTKLRSAAEMVSADIAFAKIESLGHGDDLRVMVFDLVNNRYHIAAASATNTPLTNPIGQVPYLTTFGQGRAKSLTGVTLSSYSLDGDNILTFGLFGQLDQTSDATITLATPSGATMTITVDPITGETSLASP